MSFLNRFLEGAPADDALASVVRNLSALFNARPGYASQLRDFGIGDYLCQQSRKGTHLSILREMQQVITRYEPRFRLREIKTLGRDEELVLHVLLRGLVRTERGEVPCRLLALFSLVSGAVRIEAGPLGEGPYAP